ncbi:MAG: PEGA domain-containing protein, partial [Methanomicrobiales archaeon]
ASVTITSGQTSSISATLTAQQTTGSISVSSGPSGAAVYLDGKSTGLKSPATLTGISAGGHTVSCSMSGYTDASQGVTVTAGQTVDVVLNLQATGTTTGSIYVTSLPSKALVYLDGKYLGVYSPTIINKVAAGTHTIRLTKYGYKDYTQSVMVSSGTTTTVSVTLTR